MYGNIAPISENITFFSLAIAAVNLIIVGTADVINIIKVSAVNSLIIIENVDIFELNVNSEIGAEEFLTRAAYYLACKYR